MGNSKSLLHLGLTFLVAISTLFSTGACSMKRKMDNMASTTEHMGKTTDKMSDTTDKMSGSTERIEKQSDQLKTLTNYLVVKMREVESVNTQTEQMKLMVKEGTGPSSKLDAALIYYAAMEFQAWDPSFEDKEKLEELYVKAVDLFFGVIEDHIDDAHPVTEWFPSNDWLILSAMATGMSKVHPDQEMSAKKYGYKAKSFYDLIKEGLAAKEDYEAGKPVSEYKVKILQNADTIGYLLQLRHNFFNAIILGKLTSFEDGMWEKLKMAGHWDLDMDQFMLDNGEAAVDYFNELLWKGIETKDYMKSLGIEPKINQAVAWFYYFGYLHVQQKPQRSLFPLRQADHSLRAMNSLRQEKALDLFLEMLPESLQSRGPYLVQGYPLLEY